MKRITIFSLLFSLGFIGTITAQNRKAITKSPTRTIVEVLYFHGKQRCPTCIAIGNNSQDVINKMFAPQVKSGQVRFKEIDISTPEGEKIADKYRVTWSSLFVNQWKNGKEIRNNMTTFGFENARTNTQAFRTGLQKKIIQLLK